jgi:hypothetical protein
MMIHHWFVRRQVLINLNDWRILEDTKPFPGRDRRDFWQEIIMTVATFCPESNWWTRADATNVCWPQSGTGAGHLWNLWNLIRIKIELRMWFWKMILVVSPNLPGVYLCNVMYFNRVKKSLFHHVMHQRSGTDHQLTVANDSTVVPVAGLCRRRWRAEPKVAKLIDFFGVFCLMHVWWIGTFQNFPCSSGTVVEFWWKILAHQLHLNCCISGWPWLNFLLRATIKLGVTMKLLALVLGQWISGISWLQIGHGEFMVTFI